MASQIDRLEALLAAQEKAVQDAFRQFIAEVNSEHVFAVLSDYIERGDIEGALGIVDSYVVRFADVIPEIHGIVGAATAAELAEALGDLALAISFNPAHERAAQLVRANRLSLITEFTTEQRQVTRAALAEAFQQGAGTAATARAFRNSIGLTSGQMRWALNYERNLRGMNARALEYALRDRRFDGTVERAIRLRRPLTESQITRMVERYRARALIYRSENIARSESLRATSAARQEAVFQMIEQTGISPDRIIRIWNATRDVRTRDHHASMQGQTRRLTEKFEDGKGNFLIWPGDPEAPADTTINCRCTVTFEIKPPSQEFAARR